MPWWRSSRSSSSSSPSSSPSSATAPPSPSTSQRFFNWGRGQQQPRLTRQRKIRHMTGASLDFAAVGQASEAPSSSLSMPVSRTASNLEGANLAERSESSPILLPHPLPTPEGVMASPKAESGSGSGSGRRARRSGGAAGGAGRLGALEEVPTGSNRIMDRRSAHNNNSRSPELGDIPISLSDRSQSMYTNANKSSFRLNLPPRSAPGSAFSSPMLSPRRLSTGDFSPVFAPMSPQAWSMFEHPPSDFITVYQNHVMEQYFTSPGSPLHSPNVRSPAIISTNPSPPSSPMHHMLPSSPSPPFQHMLISPPSSPLHQKMIHAASSSLHQKMMLENGSARHENNGTIHAHPLPRPPGSPVPLQSPFPASFPHQLAPKVEVPSSSLSSQWEKGKCIGSGTFGRVYMARNRLDGSTCAMKEVSLIPDDTKSAECIKQLHQEIRVLSQLKHRNIVQYYGSEIVEDCLYIYLEYVHPGSINKYIQETRLITESVVRNFTRHILEGLAFLHNENVMHRDIKGANLLVDRDGVVKLADFGMAKHLGDVGGALSLKGSPYWMAPEVLQASMNKEKTYDISVDIWSLGCTVIEMFTGKHPWDGYESAAALFKVLHESPVIPQALSPDGKDFLEKCLRRNPSERSTAKDLLKHPFITNPYHEVNGSVQASAGMKTSNYSLNGPSNNCHRSILDQATQSKRFINGHVAHLSLPNGMPNIHSEPTDVSASRYSPRSTLESIPTVPLGRKNGASFPSVSPADVAFNSAHGVSPRPKQAFALPTPSHKDMLPSDDVKNNNTSLPYDEEKDSNTS